MRNKWTGIWLNVIVALMVAIPVFGMPNITGYNVRSDGFTVTASEWNTVIGNVYSFINNQIVPVFNLFTQKGDILTFDGANFAIVHVGTDGQNLQADSGSAGGFKWAAPGGLPINTKGDLVGYTSTVVRVPVGTDGQVLTATSGNAAGVAWSTPASIPQGVIMMWSGTIASIPAGYALCDGQTHSGVATPNLQGLFVVGAGNASPGATGGMGLLNPGGPSGDNSAGAGLGPSHSHIIASSQVAGGVGGSGLAGAFTGSTTITPKYYALAYIIKL